MEKTNFKVYVKKTPWEQRRIRREIVQKKCSSNI
jgi:hypothetical protein